MDTGDPGLQTAGFQETFPQLLRLQLSRPPAMRQVHSSDGEAPTYGSDAVEEAS